MSAAHHQANKTHNKGFTQMHQQQQAGGVVLPIIVVIAVVVLIAMFVPTGGKKPVASDAQAVAERIQPVGSVEVKAAGGGAPRTGEQVWQAQCSACHATGALGSPKFGDAAAWAPRIKTGFEALLHSALKGKNSMPPQSGGEASDYEVSRALVYMANKGGANFEEPKPPADAASAAQ
jgi:cytochrome c5